MNKTLFDLNWVYEGFSKNNAKIEDFTKEELLEMCGTIFTGAVQGTCKFWESILGSYLNIDDVERLYDLVPEMEVLKVLDDLIFECEECGWWYETGEEGESEDGGICKGCLEEY